MEVGSVNYFYTGVQTPLLSVSRTLQYAKIKETKNKTKPTTNLLHQSLDFLLPLLPSVQVSGKHHHPSCLSELNNSSSTVGSHRIVFLWLLWPGNAPRVLPCYRKHWSFPAFLLRWNTICWGTQRSAYPLNGNLGCSLTFWSWRMILQWTQVQLVKEETSGEAGIVYLNEKGWEVSSGELSERVTNLWPQSAMVRLWNRKALEGTAAM